MAKLTAVYGPMFAGKTTWIINKVDELNQVGEKCLVFKPRLDDRYGSESKLHAHSGLTGRAILVDEKNPAEMLGIWTEMYEQHTVIVIDEAMFFAPKIVEVVKEMLARDLHVIVAGLDTNFRREPFDPMPHLIRLADEKTILKSKCYKCGEDAEYSARLTGGIDNIVVGAEESYQPACSACHTICEELKPSLYIYPDLRPTITHVKNYRIEVAADSMRVGKTTAVKVIAEGLRASGRVVTESYEDWQHNPYLKKSYEDPEGNFLESQKWFIKRKWEQIVEGVKNKDVFIQDVSPESDFCYGATNLQLGRMSREHFAEYLKYYEHLDWNLAPKPDLLVYLTVSDEELIKRVEASRREFETVEMEYFLMMKKVNREWLASVNGKRNILVVDTDKFDFSSDEEAKSKLTELVLNQIN